MMRIMNLITEAAFRVDMLGSSKRTQEARVALDYRFEQLLRFYRALITSTTPYTHTNHEPILIWSTQKAFEICKSLQ